MADYAVMPKADYVDACDAVREKTGGTAVIKSGDLAAKILAITTGVDTSDATATAADIAEGKTAYVNDKKVTGTASAYGYASISDDTVTFTKINGRTTFKIAAPGATASSKLRCISAYFVFEGPNDDWALSMDFTGYELAPVGSGSSENVEITFGDGVVLITLTSSSETLYDDLSDADLQDPTSWYRVKGGVCFKNT